MFAGLRRLLGFIKVTEQGDFVLISGLPADFINFAINRIWSTSKIGTNMFNRITNNQLVFHRFFIPDVLYTLKVVASDKRAGSNSVIIEKVINEIYQNTWAKSILENHPAFLKREMLDNFKKKPMPHQEAFFNTYETNTQKYLLKGFLLGAAPGSGKAHSLNVNLKGPNGDIKMRDVKIGDALYDRRFKTTYVTGVFPQGMKDIYTFTLEDGRSTEVCLEHLWKAYVNDESDVITTEAIQAYLKAGQDVFIDLPDRLGLAENKSLKVDLKLSHEKALIVQSQWRARGAKTELKRLGGDYRLDVDLYCNGKIRVKSIEFKGRELAQCISVDNPERLYLVDDYIVTHNTLMSVMLSRMLDLDTNFYFVPNNSLDRVWANTLLNEVKKTRPFWISNGNKPLALGYKDYVIHYDYMEKALDFISKHAGEFGESYVNLDESHNFNDVKSNRTGYLVQIAKDELKTHHYLSMSGTPIKAVGSEAVPLLRIIDSFFNDKVEGRFMKIYGKSQSRANDILQNRMGLLTFKVDKSETVGNEVHYYNGYVKIPNGSDYTLDSIKSEMKRFVNERMNFYKSERSQFDKEYLRILKQHEKSLETRAERNALKEYEGAVDRIRKRYDPIARKEDIVLSNKYERYTILPNLSNEDKKIFRDVKSVYKYYFLKVQGEALGRVLGRLRTQCNIDMVKHLDKIAIKDDKGKVVRETSIEKEIYATTKKTLVFTSFVEVLKEAESYFKAKGFKPMVVYGETNKELASIVEQFSKNEDFNPLIATYKSLSTAVPLTMANVTFMLNTPFRDYEREQAISRTDRIGQDSPVYCFTTLLDTDGKPNISTRSKDIMDWSKQQIEEIMGFKIDNNQVSLEDNDKDNGEEKLKSLAEQLDMGVPELSGEDDGEQKMVETDKGKLKIMHWSAW